ncbi:hypothetical protein M9H77_29656 [Catharanthus roseus]|uniref:Uncharacterized protein n=1 Tax=Catharanthus roseus TaxID=4058 RepID=A0ACB9ZX01_CATRO|nr:hypothetical protein M9H77_29656 [Catharanthus roseus]
MESSMGEKSTKANKLSQAQDVLDRKVIHHEKKNTCTFVTEEKSRKEKAKSVVSTKESEEKRKESECLIENHESLKEEQVKEKQDEIEKTQNIENEGILAYKLYKTISFLPFTSFLSFDFIINKAYSCSLYFFCDRIQSQFLNFLITIYGTKPNHGMKAKEQGMEKELSIGYEDTSLSLS